MLFLTHRISPSRRAFFTCFCLYTTLAYNKYVWVQYHDTSLELSIPLIFLLFCFAGVLVNFASAPFSAWIYPIVAVIPFEVSAPVGFLPSLSPVDYFCAAGGIVLLCRHPPGKLIQDVYHRFTAPVFWAWTAFMVYGLGDALITHGNPRGVLRWGEFLYVYFIVSLAAEEGAGNLAWNIVAWLTGLGSLLSAHALFQFWASRFDYKAVCSVFGQHNGLAGFLVFCLPASVAWFQVQKGFKRLLGAGAVILTLTAFLSGGSRGAWLGLAGSIGIMSMQISSGKMRAAWRKILLLFGTVGLAAGVVWVKNSNLRNHIIDPGARQYYWQAGWRVLQRHPLEGLGPGNYGTHIQEYLSGSPLNEYREETLHRGGLDFWQHLHNIYLQVAVEYGLAGLFLWGMALGLMVKPVFLMPGFHQSSLPVLIAFRISMVAFLLHNTVDIMFVSSLDLLFVCLLTLYSRVSRSSPA